MKNCQPVLYEKHKPIFEFDPKLVGRIKNIRPQLQNNNNKNLLCFIILSTKCFFFFLQFTAFIFRNKLQQYRTELCGQQENDEDETEVYEDLEGKQKKKMLILQICFTNILFHSLF